MNPSKTTFCALYEDGSFVEKLSIQELEAVPPYLFLIEIDYVQNMGYRYKPITKERNISIMRIGNFEIIDMGITVNDWPKKRPIKIFDHNKKSVHNFNADTYLGLDVFKREIFPLLNKLNELGSWETYALMLKADDLRVKNDKLTKDNKLLKEKIQQLEKALGNTHPKE